MTEQLNSALSAAFRDGVQWAWSATTIKMAETCLRYYQYKMIEGWTPKGSGVHIKFGGHYATAIEHFYKHLASGMDRDSAMRAIIREALIDTWEYEPCETCNGDGETMIMVSTGGVPYESVGTCPDCSGRGRVGGKPWNSEHNFKTRETLIRTIIWYLEQFKDDVAKPVILADGKPAVELSFQLPVDNDITFVGHLDRLADYANNLYVMDQKTTGSTLSARYFEQYSPDTQMSLYTFAGKAVFGVPIHGVIIDAAQIAVGFSRFERSFAFRTDRQLEEWYDSAMSTILRAQAATREAHFPMNPSACGNYGGCEFRSVCSRDPGVRKNFLVGDFNLGGGYDPLERR